MHLIGNGRVEKMLRITTEKKRAKTVLSVEGRLAGPSVATLEQCWRERATGEKFSVDLCGVSFIDAAGKALLKEIHQQGGKLIAEGCLNQAIVEEIAGRERPEKSACGSRKKGSHIIFYVAFFSLVMTPAVAHAQDSAKHSLLSGPAPSGVLRLTLNQAVSLALKQNPTAQIAILTAAESVQDKNVARAALLPQANLSVTDTVERINLRGVSWHENTRISRTCGSFPGFLGGAGIQRASVRFDAVSPLSGGARNGQRQQGR